MAIIIKYFICSLSLLLPLFAFGHTIYAPNDIPLLDNRFRIDPKTEQITFIFNHQNGPQRVVLVRPDGSKIYYQRHPESVAWVSSKTQDIVTVQNPMTGPWQAVAQLDGDNRIKLISEVQLTVNNLPLKLYQQEYITTHASLYYDKKLMDDAAYLDDAKLSVSLLGGVNKKMALYQDDGKHYDQLPFDGKLTARLYVDLLPGRYLLHIRTKNDIFIRNVNKDAVVFISPIDYEIKQREEGSEQANLVFNIDAAELDPTSVSIDGVIKDINNKVVTQVLLHSLDNMSESGELKAIQTLSHQVFTFSGKAYATTRSGREVELQLAEQIFELKPPYKEKEIPISGSVATIEKTAEAPLDPDDFIAQELARNTPKGMSIWLIATIASAFILLIAVGIFIFLRRKKNKSPKKAGKEESFEELSLDELQPTSIDIKE